MKNQSWLNLKRTLVLSETRDKTDVLNRSAEEDKTGMIVCTCIRSQTNDRLLTCLGLLVRTGSSMVVVPSFISESFRTRRVKFQGQHCRVVHRCLETNTRDRYRS